MKNLTADLLNGYVNGLECEAKKAVLMTLGVEDVEIVFNHGCVVGVNGFTWYNQTHAFFDKYADEVLECLQNFIAECGAIPRGFNFDKNTLTWLFVEETVREMVYDLDLE